MIKLREIDRRNFEEVIKLSVLEEQRSFVAPNLYSIAQSKVEPECIPLAAYWLNELVGFVMYAMDEDDKEYWVCRLMVDAKYQGNGYGKQIMVQVMDKIRADATHHKIYLSIEPDNHNARKLYERLGFMPDGRVIEGEEVLCFNH